MKLSAGDLTELAELAVTAAVEAGQMIACARPQTVERKAGGSSLASQVVTDIDRQSENLIVDILAPTLDRFELALLTEERADDGGRLSAEHFWCIDPLDGTLPFIEGVSGYAVSIALVGRDGSPHVGVVYDPAESTLIHAVAGGGVFRNGHQWRPQPGGQTLSLFADRSLLRRPDYAGLVQGLEHIALNMGLRGVEVEATAGAVMNACKTLARGPACYFKFPTADGGGSLWDFAATACLFRERGAIATDFSGAPLDLNRPDSTLMGHRGVLYTTDNALAEQIRTLHRSSTPGGG